MTPRTIKRYGWHPDLPDHRDRIFEPKVAHLPSKMDLRPQCTPVYDQGQLGSCTANSIAASIAFDLAKQGLPQFIPSRLFIYYNERDMEGTVSSDSGAQIRDGVKSCAVFGVPSEVLWPYSDKDPGPFTKKPGSAIYTAAKPHKVASYERVTQSLADLRSCLAAGFPFVFGFTVYDSFESDQVAATGVVPMPASGESVVGGHAVQAVGYDDPSQRFIVRNSWGPKWGIKGYFTIPYAYVTNAKLANDFWTLRAIAG